MKYFFPILLLITSNGFAQLTKISNERLYTLGKVWGVMKYYHPAVSQGKIDWDSVLIATLEKKSTFTEDQIITQWFDMADKTTAAILAKQNPCDSGTSRNFDIRWIEKATPINPKNKMRLLELVKRPTNIGTYYSNTINPIRFNSQNEKVYPSSANIKLLELFRIWNAIEYFYPYKYLLDHHWDKVLKKYIPVFKHIKSEQDYKLAIMQLSGEIQDTHTDLKNTYQYDVFGKLTAPFTFQVVDNGVLITAIKDEQKTKRAGIGVGDFITKIDGKTIRQIIAQKAKYIPVSNPAVMVREAYNYLFSGNDTVCVIEGFKENGKAFKANVERVQRILGEEWDKDGIPNYHLFYKGQTYEYLVWNSVKNRLDPGFRLGDKAYIEFSSLLLSDVDTLMQAYLDTKGMVFDLRGYNNKASLLKVFDYLFSTPQFFGIKTHADFSRPGKFCFEGNIINEDLKYAGKNNPNPYKGQVIVLINEYTQSAAEMWGMIFKRVPNVIFVGSQTAGADGNITNIKLTDGNELRFSGLGIYYPDGTETQRIGIKQDVFVRPTLNSIRKKEDRLLQKAFELIDAGK